MNELIAIEKIAQWEKLKQLVLDSVSSPITKRVYNMALNEFMAWFQQEPRPGFTKATVSAWRVSLEERGLGSSSIIIRMSAIRKLAAEAADNGLLAPDLAQGISRVKSAKSTGIRVGNWLSQRQAQALLSAPDVTKVGGLRDRAILAVLLGCGLRRSEVAALTFTHLQQRDGRWCIVDLVGKHGRVRTAPMPTWVKVAIDAWTSVSGVADGRIFRPVNRRGSVGGDRLGEKVVWQMLKKYAAEVGIPGIAPHDLRRTCAKLCRAAGGELEQIQLLLGHASVQTTERYLRTKQDLLHAPNDAIKLKLSYPDRQRDSFSTLYTWKGRTRTELASLLEAINVKRKTVFEFENTPFYCMDSEISTPTARGGQTLVRLKMRNLLTSAVLDKTFKAGEKFKEPDLQLVPVSYLYSDGDGSYFLDQDNFETLNLPAEVVGNALDLLVEGALLQLHKYNGNPISLQLPMFVVLEVSEAEPAVRGDTSSGSGTKMATLETGLKIRVPIFIKQGEKVKITTETREFSGRA